MPVRFAEKGRTFEHEGNEMKKVLLASTALAMTAGMAAAQGVSLSGYAEIGVKDNDVDTVFHHDLDVTFTLSGETDSGLQFGATIDLDELDNQATAGDIGSESGAHSVFVSGSFGKITMGDTDGALDWAMNEVGFGTSIADDHTTHAGFNGNSGLDGGLDGQVARYEYSFGDFAFAISAEIGADTADNVTGFGITATGSALTTAVYDPDEILGIAFKYSTDLGGVDMDFGLGFQSGAYDFATSVSTVGGTSTLGVTLVGDADVWGASVTADFDGGFSVVLNYMNLDGDLAGVVTSVASSFASVNAAAAILGFGGTGGTIEWDHYGIGVAYAVDNWIIEANYGKYDADVTLGTASTSVEADGFGLAFNYDLGGGAVIMVGYGSGESFGSTTSVDTWSAGLGLSF
ncbi:porin [Ovoidimarina sediminis]|uniref:porin n=1 Tax=Ovoidimarina sediminis TaxID=3079856 RepID=UPI00290F9D14|nr:porin [Rhodophyticola sp. MJ-SS7]MDU8943785.1 porin [Rhodophyticola sp. MJ-SS7]